MKYYIVPQTNWIPLPPKQGMTLGECISWVNAQAPGVNWQYLILNEQELKRYPSRRSA